MIAIFLEFDFRAAAFPVSKQTALTVGPACLKKASLTVMLNRQSGDGPIPLE